MNTKPDGSMTDDDRLNCFVDWELHECLKMLVQLEREFSGIEISMGQDGQMLSPADAAEALDMVAGHSGWVIRHVIDKLAEVRVKLGAGKLPLQELIDE